MNMWMGVDKKNKEVPVMEKSGSRHEDTMSASANDDFLSA
jgi:hypothetical protein